MSRILMVGDSHCDIQFMTRMVNAANLYHADVIYQLGDFGVWPGKSGIEFLDLLNFSLEHSNLDLHFIGGNHEDYDQLLQLVALDIRSRIHYIPNGTRWEYGGKKFGAIGGAFSIDYKHRVPGRSWWPDLEEAHPEDLVKLGKEKLDVFLCHDTPYADTALKFFNVDKVLEDASARTRDILKEAVLTTDPELILHGHWHKRHSYEYHGMQIEALGANINNIRDAFGILDLSTLQFVSGWDL